jgi:hypothetical protein
MIGDRHDRLDLVPIRFQREIESSSTVFIVYCGETDHRIDAHKIVSMPENDQVRHGTIGIQSES